MQTAGSFSPGAFREADSCLHRFDPRLKLVLLLGLIACLFSATSPLRLLLIFLLWLGAVSCCPGGLRDSLRVIKFMRWLLLFALLLHLFLTPGRTLFGTRWLSYDGLLRGLTIDCQLLLAVFFSLLLAWTTRPEILAWSFSRLLSPLQRIRLPVREAANLLLLVLYFFPLIQLEVSELQQQQGLAGAGAMARIKAITDLIGPLLFRLVERADQLAIEITKGGATFGIESCWVEKRLLGRDLCWFFIAILLLSLLWMV